MSDHPGRPEEFHRLYAAHFDRLLGFALRRVDRPEDAADVVAETFLVAWRRLGDVPPGDEARLWLYGVARRTLANHHRGSGRRDRLGHRLREQLATCAPDPAERIVDTLAVEKALATLGSADREVIQLALWEGLEPREIAVVLRTTSIAVRSRLSRARARLRDQLGNDFALTGHDSTREPTARTQAREEDR